MSTDLEDRLRAMYAAVADATELGDDVALVDAPASIPTRRTPLLAVLAAAAVIAIAVVVIRGGHHEPADDLSHRPFAVPTLLPEGFGLASARREPVFTEPEQAKPIPTGNDGRTVVIYDGPDGAGFSVESTIDPHVPTPGPGDGPREPLVFGVDATVATNGVVIALAWKMPGGPVVEVSGHGMDLDALRTIANGLRFVDGDLWDSLVAHGGFGPQRPDRWKVPGDGVGSVTIGGSLQAPSAVLTDFGFGFVGIPYPDCRAQWLTGNRMLVIAPPGTTSARLVVGSTDRTVQLGSPPGVPQLRLAGVRVDDADAEKAQRSAFTVTCEGSNP